VTEWWRGVIPCATDALDGEGEQSILGIDLKTLRSGVVVKTWWEDKVDETATDAWRS